jgi:hypothetical protein
VSVNTGITFKGTDVLYTKGGQIITIGKIISQTDKISIVLGKQSMPSTIIKYYDLLNNAEIFEGKLKLISANNNPSFQIYFLFNDGGIGRNRLIWSTLPSDIYYKYLNNWEWSFDGSSWFSVYQQVDSNGKSTTEDSTNFIKFLQGKNFEEGVTLLVSRTKENNALSAEKSKAQTDVSLQVYKGNEKRTYKPTSSSLSFKGEFVIASISDSVNDILYFAGISSIPSTGSNLLMSNPNNLNKAVSNMQLVPVGSRVYINVDGKQTSIYLDSTGQDIIAVYSKSLPDKTPIGEYNSLKKIIQLNTNNPYAIRNELGDSNYNLLTSGNAQINEELYIF